MVREKENSRTGSQVDSKEHHSILEVENMALVETLHSCGTFVGSGKVIMPDI